MCLIPSRRGGIRNKVQIPLCRGRPKLVVATVAKFIFCSMKITANYIRISGLKYLPQHITEIFVRELFMVD